MAEVIYQIVEHDGGWAYKLGDVFSETFPMREDAVEAARMAAARQELPNDTHLIQYQDEQGRWHDEVAFGGRTPEARVID